MGWDSLPIWPWRPSLRRAQRQHLKRQGVGMKICEFAHPTPLYLMTLMSLMTLMTRAMGIGMGMGMGMGKPALRTTRTCRPNCWRACSEAEHAPDWRNAMYAIEELEKRGYCFTL